MGRRALWVDGAETTTGSGHGLGDEPGEFRFRKPERSAAHYLERLPRPLYNSVRTVYRGGRRVAGRNPGRGRVLPDFVIIGAAKSGTSTLWAWLTGHPHVVGATRKEVEYFSFRYDRGTDWYRHHFPLESDRARFAADHGCPHATGEASPYYLPHPLAPARMASLIPGAKVIVTMRDPVDRAYSAYQMWRRWGSETESFMTVTALEDPGLDGGEARALHKGVGRCENIDPENDRAPATTVAGSVHLGRMYLKGGRYAEQLERWFHYYPREQFHFVTTDELASDPTGAFERLQAFLELPDHRPAGLKAEYVGTYDPLPVEDRVRLREYFRPHNERLYELLGRDLGWNG